MPVVNDFQDVFPDDLPEVPPPQENDFGIDLEPDTKPITIPPYRMTPVELKELKLQLTNLTDKGFIQPSISPWGSSMLFVKNKDGTLRMCINYWHLTKSLSRISIHFTEYMTCSTNTKGLLSFRRSIFVQGTISSGLGMEISQRQPFVPVMVIMSS